MAKTPSFCSGRDPPFRVAQVDGVSDIVCENGEAGSFGDGDMVLHVGLLARHHSNISALGH